MTPTALQVSFDGPVWVPTQAPSFSAYLAPHLQPLPVLPIVGVALLVAYVAGLWRLRRSGMPWSWGRTAAFLAGVLVLLLVTGPAVEGYGLEMFSVFMFQQLTLMMAVPPLLILGRPGTLLLRATPHGGMGGGVLRAAIWGLRAGPGAAALHPLVTIPVFLFTYYGLYLSPAGGALLGSWAGHISLEVLFLVAGVLFTVPVLSRDPVPRRHPHELQVGEMFIEMATHAFFGVIVIMTASPLVAAFTHPPRDWGVDIMGDQAVAGALAWSYGELPALVLLLIVFARWQRADTLTARAADVKADRDGDAQLQAYNAYLAQLRDHDA